MSKTKTYKDTKASCQQNDLRNVSKTRPGHTKFLFSGQKKMEISGHFSGHQSHKNAFFVISGAYNFGTFRAEAKITIRRHEVVYRLSSEHKMIDLE